MDTGPIMDGVGEHAAFSRRQFLCDNSHEGLVAVHKKVLYRLELFPLFVLEDDLRPADADFEILTTKHFDQNDKLKLSPAPHNEAASALHLFNLDGNIVESFLAKALE